MAGGINLHPIQSLNKLNLFSDEKSIIHEIEIEKLEDNSMNLPLAELSQRGQS